MHDGALDNALETQCGLGINVIITGNLRGVVLDKVGQRLTQVIHIGRTCAQDFGSAWVVEQGQQQVLHGDELVALLAGLYKGHVQANF